VGFETKEGSAMRHVKYLLLLAFLAVPAAYSHAQVSFGVGVQIGPDYGYYNPPPICPYGYYPDYPFGCAPYGYWGPEWFVDGVFIGAGPWYHFYYSHPDFYRGYYAHRFYRDYDRGDYWRRGGWDHGFRGEEHGFRGDRGFRGGDFHDRGFRGGDFHDRGFRGGDFHDRGFRGGDRAFNGGDGFRGRDRGFHGGGEFHGGGRGEFHGGGGHEFHGGGGHGGGGHEGGGHGGGGHGGGGHGDGGHGDHGRR
jgi:hypothetical protein